MRKLTIVAASVTNASRLVFSRCKHPRVWSVASRVTRHVSRAALCGAALALVACATSTNTPPSVPTRDAATLESWEARGRIAVAGANGGGSGSFVWAQQGAEARVSLRGPVGV